MVNWPIKKISRYISAHENFIIEITPSYERKPQFTLYTPIKNSHIFSNWLIVQLDQLMTIYKPIKVLEVKSLLQLKLNLKTHLIH